MTLLITGGTSFLLGLALTPLVIVLARRAGLVARPRADRWSIRPTALMGGTAIFGAFAGGLALTSRLSPDLIITLAAASLIFAVGFADDLRSLRPQHKLLAQVAAACILVAGGVHFGIEGGNALTWLLTILFVVGITNALNLLDNMDGLAAGVASTAALVLMAGAAFTGNGPAAAAAAGLAGAALSFLVYNFHPARVFMGDCGSMFLGLTLAALAIQTSTAAGTAAAWAILFPCVALAVPIFDTTFVTVMRKLHGRAISQGGCDHTSHRLVRLGLSEPQAVLLLCGVSLLIGAPGVAAMVFRAPLLLVVGDRLRPPGF
jgi:UDP-GlcNAc:undecaprenyl-phosphate GlcNAc-1-phosphate transferase